jgi:hypothetical protein
VGAITKTWLYAGRAGGIGASNNDLSRESRHERETRAPDEDPHRLLGRAKPAMRNG